MNISKQDFLVLNLEGIDLFMELTDAAVAANKGATFEQCARELQRRIHEYRNLTSELRARPSASVVHSPVTMTIRKLLERRTCNLPAFRGSRLNVVYLIRDGDKVMYVGVSHYNARKRLKSHYKQHSPLGDALRTNENAINWTVEMIPHSDYQEAAQKEKQLIAELNPPFCRRQ